MPKKGGRRLDVYPHTFDQDVRMRDDANDFRMGVEVEFWRAAWSYT